MNYSTDYFRAIGKITVSREESCHMLKSSSIQVYSDEKSLTSNMNFIMTNIGQGDVRIVYYLRALFLTMGLRPMLMDVKNLLTLEWHNLG